MSSDVLQAKGFPDLATRQFLHAVHAAKPHMPIFCLVDFDPDGIAILRNYKYGSLSLEHEKNSTVLGMQWLGIISNDVLSIGSSTAVGGDSPISSQGSHYSSNQNPEALSFTSKPCVV